MTADAYPSEAPEGWRGAKAFCAGRGFGPPLIVKALIVLLAFRLFPPLGLLALGVMAWKYFARRRGFAPWGQHSYDFTRNSAFVEKRRQDFEAMAAEDKAFADFERAQREAADREAFQRFMNERGASK